jgi:uncharacterized protein YfiM (DUF2279 family)
VKNKLLRLAEIIQEDFPDELVEAFRSSGNLSLAKKIEFVGEARAAHQRRSETLWLKAGKKRTLEERNAAAREDLAAFVFAYLIGDAKEYAESAVEALKVLGRHGEVELIVSLAKR